MDSYNRIDANLKQICKECKFYSTSDCIPSRCNIGFASNAIIAAKNKGRQIIEDGSKLMPRNDMKVYDESMIAKSIASVCGLCKECREGHSENCVVSLSRRSLENTQLKEDVVYPGNVLMYLINVSKQNPTLADKIKTEYTQIIKESEKDITIDKSAVLKKAPILVELKKGETYYWCTCSKSTSQPFCNGAHVGTSFVPLAFTAEKDETAHICTCKHTKNPPYCDGSHREL